ncbi:MAG: RNA-binding S4 domain-containing protein [Rikenellaceae bacterium]
MQNIRLDKYLWAVRIFKTRSDAADAIRNNRVLVNDAYAKPSRDVKRGDRLTVKKNNILYSYQVVELISNRQGAKNVPDYCLDTTPQSELDKLNRPKETIFITRDPGTGRPTKRDRRELDSLMDALFEESDS